MLYIQGMYEQLQFTLYMKTRIASYLAFCAVLSDSYNNVITRGSSSIWQDKMHKTDI